MKLKRLKVLLPALTGMLLTNGTFAISSNQQNEFNNLSLQSLLDYGKKNKFPMNENDRIDVKDNIVYSYNSSDYQYSDGFGSKPSDWLSFYRKSDDPFKIFFDLKCRDSGSDTYSDVYTPYFAEIDSQGNLVLGDKVENQKVSDFYNSEIFEKYKNPIKKNYVVTRKLERSDILIEIGNTQAINSIFNSVSIYLYPTSKAFYSPLFKRNKFNNSYSYHSVTYPKSSNRDLAIRNYINSLLDSSDAICYYYAKTIIIKESLYLNFMNNYNEHIHYLCYLCKFLSKY